MSNAKSWVERKYWNEAIETMPREELEKFQLEKLKEIIKHSYENSPYYKRTWDEAGLKPEDIQSLEDLQKFPFINKITQRETQGVGSFLGELAAVPEDDVVFISTSSGSTGVPEPVHQGRLRCLPGHRIPLVLADWHETE